MDETKGMERRKRSTSMEEETIERVERINGRLEEIEAKRVQQFSNWHKANRGLIRR